MNYEIRIAELEETFPTLREAPLRPWNAEAFDAWAFAAWCSAPWWR